MIATLPVSTADKTHLEWECAQVLGRLFRLLDEGRYEEVATLFGSEGVWHRQGTSLRGSAAVLTAMKARPPQQVTRHLASIPFVELKNDGQALVTASVTAMAGMRNGDASLPIRTQGPFRILDTRLSLQRLDDGRWEISELANLPVFEFANEPHGPAR